MRRVMCVLVMGVLGGMLGACQTREKAVPEASTASETSPALVRVGKRVLTQAEVQAQADQMPLEVRVEYTTPPKQREFVQKFVDQEILAAEAERLGYDRSPEVLAAVKRAMAVKLLKERIGNGPRPEEVSETAVKQYYLDHPAEFGPPEKVRVAVLFVRDGAKAASARAEAEQAVTAASNKAGYAEQFAAFQTFVKSYSEEPGARDVTLSLGVEGSSYPKTVVEAAAQLKEVGRLSELIETPQGYFVLQLKERVPGLVQPFEEVKEHAARSLSDALRNAKVTALVAQLAKQHNAQVYEDRFASVHFAPDPLMQPPTVQPARDVQTVSPTPHPPTHVR
jgi:parvulin-like peptidyl-prolyl isomerase